MIYKEPTIYKIGSEFNIDLSFTISDFEPNKYYYAGALVKYGGKIYLHNSSQVLHGQFNVNDWQEIEVNEINMFRLLEITSDANLFNYSTFSYNPFTKIFIAHINVCFNAQIQTSYNLSSMQMRLDKPFLGYGAASGYSLDSYGNIKTSVTPINVQVLDPQEVKPGFSFWTNGLSGVFGMNTDQVIGWLITEKDN